MHSLTLSVLKNLKLNIDNKNIVSISGEDPGQEPLVEADTDDENDEQEPPISDAQRKREFLQRFNPEVKKAAESLKESIKFHLEKKVKISNKLLQFVVTFVFENIV